LELASDDGATLGVGAEVYGPLVPLTFYKPLVLSPSAAQTNRLRAPLALAGDRVGGLKFVAGDKVTLPGADQPAVSVIAVFEPRPRNLSAPAQMLLGGGTNWLEGAALSEALGALQASQQSEAALHESRVTVTQVGWEEKDDGRWLTADIISNLTPNWETDFHVRLDRELAETRVHSLQETVSDSAWFRHERLACRLPSSVSGREAQALRDELFHALVAQTMVLAPGKDLPLFARPVGELGVLTGTVSLRSSTGSPSVRMNFTGVELIKEKDESRLSLEYAREDHGAELSFQTSGLIPGGTVDLLGSTTVQDHGSNRAAFIRHRISLALPPRLTEDEAMRLRQAAADKWLGASLLVHAGDQHTLFTVPVPDGGEVTVFVLGKEASSPP